MSKRVNAASLHRNAHLSLPSEAQAESSTQAEREDAPTGRLDERYVVPPFSVLNTQRGEWQARKRQYLSLGIQSELGRGEGTHRRDNASGAGTWGVNPDGTSTEKRGAVHGRKASPGGSPRPAAQRGKDGHTVRGSGSGRPLATTYGQYSPEDIGAGKNGMWKTGGPRPHSNHTGNRDLRPGREPGSDYTGGDVWTSGPRKGGEEDDYLASGTSIFDPVLCELMYRWFCPAKGYSLDPFAGGSVRGIVAALWGRSYLGIDLRPEQVEANKAQLKLAPKGSKIKWIVGDARDVNSLVRKAHFDFLFTCPPYFNLELYSYDPADLSNAEDYGAFSDSYRSILMDSVAHLRDDRFAALVVGNFRDRDGYTLDFVGDTIRAMEQAGARLYNELILVTAIGSLPLRTRNQFRASRKTGKTHQQVLIFVKGDPRKAAQACRSE